MVSATRRQIIGGGGAPINKRRRRRRPQIVGGGAALVQTEHGTAGSNYLLYASWTKEQPRREIEHFLSSTPSVDTVQVLVRTMLPKYPYECMHTESEINQRCRKEDITLFKNFYRSRQYNCITEVCVCGYVDVMCWGKP